jgi:choline dehydrogenase-like flavoprotein
VENNYDYIIIGSGFGGSVSALRLSEKGYKVLVIEKGKWYNAKDFAKTNWNLKKWFWIPSLRFFGIMRLSIFRHIVTISELGLAEVRWFMPTRCLYQSRGFLKPEAGVIWPIGKRTQTILL